LRAFESWMLAYLLNSIWQVPLVFVAAWIAARFSRLSGPRLEHRVWVGALLLEALLPACTFRLGDLWRATWGLVLWTYAGGGVAGGRTRVVIGPGIASGAGLFRLPAGMLMGMMAAYGCCLLYFAGRLGWGLWRTTALRLRADRVILTGEAAGAWQQCSRRFGTGPDSAELAVTLMVSGPVTVGIRRRVLLVPPGFLERVTVVDLNAVLAHEFAHMQRRDFEKNLLYRVLSSPVAYHPLLWLTGSRLAETREMLCDAMAAEALSGRENYARSLLRLASMLVNPAPARTLHAIGFFDASIFERRVMTLTQQHAKPGRLRQLLMVGACAAVALATCASALALRMEVSTTPSGSKVTKISVDVKNLTVLERKPPVYPVEAKASKNTINGSVILRVVIGKDGEPENINVAKSLRGDYDKSALDAVRQWRWQPFLLNGQPIEVETNVTIVYSLAK
jgi:TonB family protein